MSSSYAEGLSPYEHKGKLGLPEHFDDLEEVSRKVDVLCAWIKNSQSTVVFTGAGVSTSAGIPDFRGPKGVWTLEKKGLKPEMGVTWDDAKPTRTHRALAKLVTEGQVQFVISQNIDGLHLRSGLPRKNLAELHGNMFVDECNICQRMFVRPSAAETVGRKCSGVSCPASRSSSGRPCRGKLQDFVLDWEDELPDDDLTLSMSHSVVSDLSIVIGSTLQIIPAGNMPTYTKKKPDGRLVIINLQPTKHDKKADLVIRAYADKVFESLLSKLGHDIPEYDVDCDPIRKVKAGQHIEWTQSKTEAKRLQKVASKIEEELRLKRKLKKLNGAQNNDKATDPKEEIKEEVFNQECTEEVKEEVFNHEVAKEEIKDIVPNDLIKDIKDEPERKKCRETT